MGRLYSNSLSSVDGIPLLGGVYALMHRGGDEFFSLPEEVQEQVNAHENQFRSENEMQNFIHDIMRRG